MDRIKSFDATGVAPNGRLYAGDLNLLQDTVAALTDFAQNLSVSSLAVGAADTTLTHYGAQEMAVSGLMRVLGVFRAASGIVVGSYTTAQRDAIVNPAYGLVILNQTTNKYEWNSGTPAVPVWSQLGGSPISRGAFGAMPAPSATNVNTIYLATDQNGGTAYYSDGTTWTQLAAGVSSTSSFTQVVGDGATTSFAIAHNLGTQNVIVQVRQNAAPFSRVEPEIQVTNNNSVTVVFDTAPTAGQYAVTVIGGVTGAANVPAAHASSHAAGGSDSLPWGTIHGIGTHAARPAAAAVNSGYLYFETDTGILFESNGAAWVQLTRPVADEISYTEFTATVSLTATTEATANTVVTAPPLTGDGVTAYWIEFYACDLTAGDNTDSFLILYENGVSIGIIGRTSSQNTTSGSVHRDTYVKRKMIPGAGAKTYSIRGYNNMGNGVVQADVGGATKGLPGYLRISKA